MLGQSLPYLPPTALLDQLHSIRQDNNALRHYLHRKLRMVMKELQNPFQLRLTFQSHYFNRLVLATHLSKMSRLQSIIMKNALKRMMTIKERKKKRTEAMNHARVSLKRKVFREWQKESQVEEKFRLLLKVKKMAEWTIFSEIVKCKMHNKLDVGVNTLLTSIHTNYLIKLCFYGFACEVKVAKIMKIRRRVIRKVCDRIKTFNKRSKILVQSFRDQFLLKRSMASWKEGLHFTRSQTLWRATLLRSYFNNWVKFMVIEDHQRSIDNANQIILQDYLQRKLAGHLLGVFLEWRNYTVTTLHNKQENMVVKQYAQLKQRDCLMRGAFSKLLLNVGVSKMDRFRANKLKTKVLETLKAMLVRGSLLLERVVGYVKSKEVGRYFHAIKQFNQKEKQTIKRFLLKKAFDSLSVKLVMGYFMKVTRAQQYHTRSLRLKVLVGLRELMLYRRREKWLINKINVVNPLRMWRREWRLRNYALKKQIIREWKIANIRYQ